MNHDATQTPWPNRNQIKRKSPGIAVIGRSWLNNALSDLPYLIGQMLDDAALLGDTVCLELSGKVDQSSEPYINVRLIAIEDQLPKPYGFHWDGNFILYLKAYIDNNMKNVEECHPLQMYCKNDGDFWENIPRNLHLFDRMKHEE